MASHYNYMIVMNGITSKNLVYFCEILDPNVLCMLYVFYIVSERALYKQHKVFS
jgi:hypothetical protein